MIMIMITVVNIIIVITTFLTRCATIIIMIMVINAIINIFSLTRCAGLASKLSLDFALMHKERVKAGEINRMILVIIMMIMIVIRIMRMMVRSLG